MKWLYDMKDQILKIVSEHKDSFVQIIKAKFRVFYDDINNNFNGKSFSEKLYRWNKGDNNPGKCEHCGLECKFITFGEGYRSYCSTKCANIVNRKKLSEEYKLNPPEKNKEYWEDKICKLCNRFFSALKFRKQLFCSNECSSKFTANDSDRLNKIRKTKLEKYGCETYVNPEKAKQTCIEKYGANNVGQVLVFKNKARNTFLKKYIYKLRTSNRLKNIIEPLFSENDFISTFRTNKYPFKCKKCNNIFEDNLDDGRIPRCLKCFPIICGKSHGEEEVKEYIISLLGDKNLIESRSRKILSNKELDIYIPSLKIAIEYNGLFWHSESQGKISSYHLNKTIECEKMGIKLIHIFEDEWIYRQDIVKNRIKCLLRMGSFQKIHARKCEIKNIKYLDIDCFLDDNHIQGSVTSPINIGLFYNNNLVSVASFGHLRISNGEFNDNETYELFRFCSLLDVIVRGGLSKLVKYFIKTYNPTKIISYVDRRWGTGNSYEKSGFKLSSITSPNYWYIKNGDIMRRHRFGFRKSELHKKLKVYDPNLTGWENMQLNGYDRIWDCGNYKYEWNRS